MDSLKAISEAATIRPSPELRNEAIAALALTDLRHLRTIEPEGAVPLWLDFDPLLERYLTLDHRGDIRLHGATAIAPGEIDASSAAILTNVLRGPFRSIIWSPDGRRVAVICRDRQFQVSDLSKTG